MRVSPRDVELHVALYVVEDEGLLDLFYEPVLRQVPNALYGPNARLPQELEVLQLGPLVIHKIPWE